MNRAALLLTLGLALVSRAAAGDDRPDVAQAEKRLNEGADLFLQGKFEEARLRYVQACAVLRTYNCLRALAIAELRAGKPADAYRHFKELFDDPKATAKLDSKSLRTLQALMNEAYGKSGHIAVDAPNGLTIVLDDVDAGVTPLGGTLDVMPGTHRIAVHGDATRAVVVNAIAGQIVKATLPEQASAPPTSAPAPAVAPAPAPVAAASAPSPPSAGVPKDSPTAATAEPFWNTRRVVGASVAGLGLVALGTGVFFASQAQSDKDQASSLAAANGSGGCAAGSTSSSCAALRDALDAQSRDHSLNVAFVVTGAAAIAVGGALFFWPTSSPRTTSTFVAPVVAPGFAGIRLRGEL